MRMELLPPILLLVSASLLGVAGQDMCPSRCHCELEDFPTTVNCSGRQLFGFPASIDSQVNVVDLSHNIIREVPSTLSELKELRHLSLSFNRIMALKPWTFYDLQELLTLDLSFNDISNLADIHGNTFVIGAGKLQTLNLSGNAIKVLDMEDSTGFIKSLTVEVLDLSACNISYIQKATFLNGLANLKTLNLSRNPLKWVSSLTSITLQHLDLSRCLMDDMAPSALVNLPSLKSLILSRNREFRFSSRNAVFSKSLNILEARSCKIVLQSLRGFPNLTHVNLRDNNIEEIPSEPLNNSKLVELDLSRNNIKRISQTALINLYDLQILNLERNSFSRLNWNIFSNNVKLTTVTLSKNLLTWFNFSSISITTLDVSHCSIQGFSLSAMPALLKLYLSDNKIEYIPNDFRSSTISELDLSSCRLSAFGNDTFQELPNLRVLNLAGNRLTMTLKDYLFSSNEYLHELLLSNNPWICDCDSEGFHDFVLYLKQLNANDLHEVRCSSPESVRGKSWEEACFNVWYRLPEQEAGMFQRYGVVVLVGALSVGALCLLIKVVRHALKTRRKKRSERRQEEEQEQYRSFDVQAEFIRHNLGETDSMVSTPRPTPRSRPRIASEPPTYEEAVLMSRSQEDLLRERETRAKEVATSTEDRPDEPHEETADIQRWESDGDYDEVSSGSRRSSAQGYELSDIHVDSSNEGDTDSETRPTGHKQQNTHS